MASSKIKSDIQRDGFIDKAGSGTEGQIRTLNSSNEEVWANAPSGGGSSGSGSGALFDGGRRVGTGGSVLDMGRRV